LVERVLCKHNVIGSIPFISKNMKYILLKDQRRRNLTARFEFRRKWLRALYEDLSLPFDFRSYIYKELFTLPKDSSLTRLRNRCVLTNRPRGIYKKFGLSRLMFRKYI
jgi:ribosomal protein S14